MRPCGLEGTEKSGRKGERFVDVFFDEAQSQGGNDDHSSEDSDAS